MIALLAIVAGLILYGTLYPFRFNFHHTDASPLRILLSSWPTRLDRFVFRDAAVNIAMFLPLGAAAFLVFVRRMRPAIALAAATLLGSALSAGIEMLQIYDLHRDTSAADWLCNTAGAFLGAAVALMFQPETQKILSPAGRRGGAAGLLLAVCWMATQLYPLVPVLGRTHLHGSLTYLVRSPVSSVETFAGAAAWFVFGLALQAAWGRVTTGRLALTMLAIPARLLIADRVVSKSDLFAGLLALLLWAVINDKARMGVAWLLLLAAIVIRELAPFHFGRFHGFSWIPFGATISAERSPSITVILRKAFEYGSMVWLLRSGNIGYLAGGVMVAALLGAFEAMQCFMPGRQAEITDSVLALLMALVLRLIG